jgi:hypothetical protein
LNSAAIFIPGMILSRHLARVPDDALPLWAQALQQLSVFFLTLSWVLPGHLALRLLGGRRPLRTTFALFAFMFGGPLLVIALAGLPVYYLGQRPELAKLSSLHVVGWTIFIAWLVAFVWYSVRLLASAHRLAWWRGLIATAVMYASSTGFHLWLARHHATWARIL